jgi:hypothetical protein
MTLSYNSQFIAFYNILILVWFFVVRRSAIATLCGLALDHSLLFELNFKLDRLLLHLLLLLELRYLFRVTTVRQAFINLGLHTIQVA